MQLRAVLPLLGSLVRDRSRPLAKLGKSARPARRLTKAALVLPAALMIVGNSPSGGVSITVNGLRNTKGYVRACITAAPRLFPNCDRDPASRKVSVAAINGAVLNFPNMPAGRYAIALIHDENGNGRMDKTLMLPKEGFGFSRDAPVRMGPPSFSAAAFDIGDGVIRSTIRVRYM